MTAAAALAHAQIPPENTLPETAATMLAALPEALQSFLDGGHAELSLRVLVRTWRFAALGRELPLYDEVVLGRIGRAADKIALVRQLSDGQWEIARIGTGIAEWLMGRETVLVDDTPPDCAHVLRDLLGSAIDQGSPGYMAAHTVRDGAALLYDLVALPLSNRWGRPLLLLYANQRAGSYSLIDAIFASTPDGLLALAPVRDLAGSLLDFRIVSLNGGAAAVMERPEGDIRWHNLTDLFPRLIELGAIDRLGEVLRSGEVSRFEIAHPRADGTLLHLSIRASAMGDMVAASLSDITELKIREESFRLLFEDSPLPMLVYSPQTTEILDVNHAAIEHYGYSREDFLSRSMLDIRPEEDREHLLALWRSAEIRSDAGDVWRHVKADDTVIEVRVFSRPVLFHGRMARINAIVDVTEQRQTEAQIRFLAHHDPLTGLPNRSLFGKELRTTISEIKRHGHKAAVLCIDLDNFKVINDTLGHPAGDALLTEVATRLQSEIRDNDIVARLGGDEFSIIQRNIEAPGQAGALAERLIAVLSRPYEIDGQEVVTGASIGIALAPTDAMGSADLLKCADMALYRAKADGRGTFSYFQRHMDEQVRARRTLELELRQALLNGQFTLAYQPIIATEAGTLTGFEALLRWQHPVRGTVSPAEFIPLAEEIGLIVPIGEWVLREACREAAQWPGHIHIAVNLSPIQFRGGRLPHVVAQALAVSGLAPERLELEITESVLLADSQTNLKTLHALRTLGVRISMDDFGTGYSSLSYLRSFPFDKIKIDQSFVREMSGNKDDQAIVRAVTSLGASLGISTTAEGVETEDQLHQLRQQGCTEVQGYLIGRPTSPAGVAEILSRFGGATA